MIPTIAWGLLPGAVASTGTRLGMEETGLMLANALERGWVAELDPLCLGNMVGAGVLAQQVVSWHNRAACSTAEVPKAVCRPQGTSFHD